MPSKLSMDFNSLQTIGKNEQNKNKNLIIPAWISHVVYQAKLFQWHHRLKVKKISWKILPFGFYFSSKNPHTAPRESNTALTLCFRRYYLKLI